MRAFARPRRTTLFHAMTPCDCNSNHRRRTLSWRRPIWWKNDNTMKTDPPAITSSPAADYVTDSHQRHGRAVAASVSVRALCCRQECIVVDSNLIAVATAHNDTRFTNSVTPRQRLVAREKNVFIATCYWFENWRRTLIRFKGTWPGFLLPWTKKINYNKTHRHLLNPLFCVLPSTQVRTLDGSPGFPIKLMPIFPCTCPYPRYNILFHWADISWRNTVR